MKTYTLITGASMGIGRSLAHECASRGMSVVLAALEEPLLSALAVEIRARYGVDAVYYALDLTDTEAIRRIYAWCRDNGYQVNRLLSNAGMGLSGLYEGHALEKYRKLVLLNNMAAVELVHHFMPMLKASGAGYIMLTSSMEATIPIPYKAVYTATKHFLYGFALALGEELREYGVGVTVLCPGPVATNEGSLARMKQFGKPPGLMMPDEVARIAVDGMMRGKRVVVPGFLPGLVMGLMAWFPVGIRMRILHRVFRKYKTVQQ
jgi:uncharacterized protein